MQVKHFITYDNELEETEEPLLILNNIENNARRYIIEARNILIIINKYFIILNSYFLFSD